MQRDDGKGASSRCRYAEDVLSNGRVMRERAVRGHLLANRCTESRRKDQQNADIRKSSVALAGEQVAALEAAVEAGEYATTGEIVREAARLAIRASCEDTCRLWDEGKASGPAEPLDFGELRMEARRRLAEIQKAKAMVAGLIGNPEARKDLLEIYIAIGLDNPAAAERLYTTIEAKADRLRRHPRLGPRRPDIRAAARFSSRGLTSFSSRPALDTDEGPVDAVEILRVVDGRRDLTNLV